MGEFGFGESVEMGDHAVEFGAELGAFALISNAVGMGA